MLAHRQRISLLSRLKTSYEGLRLDRMGKRARIDWSVCLYNPSRIRLDDDVKLYRGVTVNARSKSGISIHLGKSVRIHEFSFLDDYGGNIFLDDYVGIGHFCVIGGHGGLRVGRYSMIGGLTYIVPANHNFRGTDTPYMFSGESKKGISIGENVWIGARSVVLDGTSIGDNSVIGAGSVVTKSIPANSLAVGNPASIIETL